MPAFPVAESPTALHPRLFTTRLRICWWIESRRWSIGYSIASENAGRNYSSSLPTFRIWPTPDGQQRASYNRNYGFELSDRPVRVPRGGFAGGAQTAHRGTGCGSHPLSRGRARAERRSAGYTVPTRWLDRSPSGSPFCRQPHERLHTLPAGADRGRTDHPALRPREMGETGRCHDTAGRGIASNDRIAPPPVGSAAQFAVRRGLRPPPAAPRIGRAAAGHLFGFLCLALPPSCGSHHFAPGSAELEIRRLPSGPVCRPILGRRCLGSTV